ncbi:hypothetical protein VTL71DRAFT_9460 [Oculimacula yallundae]|uniref:Uncharacterized protein n=1 Tax=Oculimacula yallundae TaxID=86028 RepID=A0ABR4BS03_9HELO
MAGRKTAASPLDATSKSTWQSLPQDLAQENFTELLDSGKLQTDSWKDFTSKPEADQLGICFYSLESLQGEIELRATIFFNTLSYIRKSELWKADKNNPDSWKLWIEESKLSYDIKAWCKHLYPSKNHFDKQMENILKAWPEATPQRILGIMPENVRPKSFTSYHAYAVSKIAHSNLLPTLEDFQNSLAEYYKDKKAKKSYNICSARDLHEYEQWLLTTNAEKILKPTIRQTKVFAGSVRSQTNPKPAAPTSRRKEGATSTATDLPEEVIDDSMQQSQVASARTDSTAKVHKRYALERTQRPTVPEITTTKSHTRERRADTPKPRAANTSEPRGANTSELISDPVSKPTSRTMSKPISTPITKPRNEVARGAVTPRSIASGSVHSSTIVPEHKEPKSEFKQLNNRMRLEIEKAVSSMLTEKERRFLESLKREDDSKSAVTELMLSTLVINRPGESMWDQEGFELLHEWRQLWGKMETWTKKPISTSESTSSTLQRKRQHAGNDEDPATGAKKTKTYRLNTAGLTAQRSNATASAQSDSAQSSQKTASFQGAEEGQDDTGGAHLQNLLALADCCDEERRLA